jgi:hypothetical protein
MPILKKRAKSYHAITKKTGWLKKLFPNLISNWPFRRSDIWMRDETKSQFSAAH